MVILLWLFSFFVFLSLVIGQCRDNFLDLELYRHICREGERTRLTARKSAVQSCFDTLIATIHETEESDEKKRDLKKSEKPKGEVKEKIFLDIAPHSSRFNLAVLFKKDCALYKEGVKRLLQRRSPAAEAILQEIMAKGEWVTAHTKKRGENKVSLEELSDIAKISFENPQSAYKLLKEGLDEVCIFEPDRTKYRISVHHASEEVLAALIGHEALAHDIIDLRTKLYKEGKRELQSNKKTAVSDKFLKEDDLKSLFHSHGLEWEKYKEVVDLKTRSPTQRDLAHDQLARKKGRRKSKTVTRE